MKLYHGSNLVIKNPDISFSRKEVDFGRGFYTTPMKEQAISWAKRFKKRQGQGVISTYEIDELKLSEEVSILTFSDYTIEWLDFIMACRQGGSDNEGYDVVIGGVADDQVFNTIQLFIDGLIGKEESLKRLRYDKPNLQYCFCNQKVMDKYLTFVSSEVI